MDMKLKHELNNNLNENSDSITFLGTGGGRFVILSQRRYSGGLWLNFNNTKILFDPGPGSLIRTLQFHKDPAKLDAVFVSHNHLDHYNDCELMIEGMTKGMKRTHGTLVTTNETLEYISDYHKGRVNVIVPKINEKFRIGNVLVVAIPTYKHPGIGFKFFTNSGIVIFTADTGYSDELIKNYENAKVLILNVIFPRNKELETHLNTECAVRIIKKLKVKPELVIIQHFGIGMLNANPEREAEYIEKETGVRVIAAGDGMVLNVLGLEVLGGDGDLQQKLGDF